MEQRADWNLRGPGPAPAHRNESSDVAVAMSMRVVGVLLLLGIAAIFFDACGSRPTDTPVAANRITDPEAPGYAQATFAGGCFWCMEPPFDKLDGVVATISGYTAGETANPTYEQVSAGGTGHTEAVRILYDPSRISYEDLLEVYWRNVDPVDAEGQFCDRGTQYRSGVYTHGPEQHALALASRERVQQTLQQNIVTEVIPATAFYAAEGYHQDYYEKNPLRYKYYRNGCGRDRRLQELWGASGGK